MFPPITVPPPLQPIIQAWTVWFTTTFFTIPMATALAIWDLPSALYNLFFGERPKVILITGANSGIGEKLAEEYSKLPGVTLGLLARNKEHLNRVANNCRKRGANVDILVCDITDKEVLNETINDFYDRYPIDLLIANAAQAGVKYDGDEERWEDRGERYIDVNLIGTVNTVMAGFKRMREKKGGQIAITSSILGHYSAPQMIYYNATKYALVSFARDLRYLGAPHDIKVSVIAPGIIDTPMTSDPKQPLKFYSWIFASPRNLAIVTKLQLYANRFEITWPFVEMLPAFAAQSLPPRVTELVTHIIGRVNGFITGVGDEAFT
ncbi:3344_t:CDS:2 [Diversispora eburnea]|uniref:3344_t:CDS:1 n=1 Tax=Diversispora eburnea TaxID=1213867 RepID=A0A9N9F200_9GLOM|nr:3344_t:CDS:2 [Diversispora eburnea]